MWKRRFPVLSLGIRLKVETALTVIVAVGVLHNIAVDRVEREPPLDPEVILPNLDFIEEIDADPPNHHNFHNAREVLLNEYFPALVHERQHV